MKTYKLRIKKAVLIPGERGNNIQISMIKLVDENDKYIKFIKLNEKTIETLLNTDITIQL
jgi:hypothetical protein